jgi:hypothetical protein
MREKDITRGGEMVNIGKERRNKRETMRSKQ